MVLKCRVDVLNRAALEPYILSALVDATDEMARRLV